VARKRVLFGANVNWEPAVRARLNSERYDYAFANFRTFDISLYDLVVPLQLHDYIGLRQQDSAARGRAIFPAADVVELCHDKLRFNQLVATSPLGWSIPRVLERVPPLTPFIVKRRKDVNGHSAQIAHTPADSLRLRAALEDPAYFAQTYVPGDTEFATHILVRSGEPLYHLNIVYQMGVCSYVKNNQCKPLSLTTNRDEAYLSFFMSVLKLIGYDNGTCCFDYKFLNGRVQLLELNPRCGGSLREGLNDYLAAYETAVTAG
jgi:hypothetical protein